MSCADPELAIAEWRSGATRARRGKAKPRYRWSVTVQCADELLNGLCLGGDDLAVLSRGISVLLRGSLRELEGELEGASAEQTGGHE